MIVEFFCFLIPQKYVKLGETEKSLRHCLSHIFCDEFLKKKFRQKRTCDHRIKVMRFNRFGDRGFDISIIFRLRITFVKSNRVLKGQLNHYAPYHPQSSTIYSKCMGYETEVHITYEQKQNIQIIYSFHPVQKIASLQSEIFLKRIRNATKIHRIIFLLQNLTHAIKATVTLRNIKAKTRTTTRKRPVRIRIDYCTELEQYYSAPPPTQVVDF
ncbi:hypothetical protein Bhyg_05329 [Pseudolycoriella hygida]|uniref:Uncharacterized protein n=1 Tax=Pseudolycoriella hygida TaxID=35572 RepID=A0A9Q0NGZ8_9DIPT|nr:hypothetical protein Bhyg_05329 [Pseudolycoriella hygida]